MIKHLLGIKPAQRPGLYKNIKPFFEMEAQATGQRTYPLAQLKGNVVLVVNTASQCGLTPQYEALEQLQKQYHSEGFTVLAFPSDNFKNQEFSSDEKIQEFCNLRFNITFPLMAKTDVKGPQAHPVWQYLSQKSKNGFADVRPMWNFQKYLISREGYLVDYWMPILKPDSPKVHRAIRKQLALPAQTA